MTGAKDWQQANRLGGLRRFAVAITALNVLGHSVLGFEQSIAQPLVALATAYFMELVLAWIDTRAKGRSVQYGAGLRSKVDFLLSAHITGLATSMLLYANESLAAVAFASGVAIGSKYVFRVWIGRGSRHVFNPSNLGITVTLLLFPWVGIAPPYHFTENVSGAWDWLLPGLIVVTGTFLNARFTHRLPLISAWLIGFALQAVVRNLLFDTAVLAGLVPMTGLAFVLFTFYMITDPATSPGSPRAQIGFGFSVALIYGLLMAAHIVFGLFFALTVVCLLRGLAIVVLNAMRSQARYGVARSPVPIGGQGAE